MPAPLLAGMIWTGTRYVAKKVIKKIAKGPAGKRKKLKMQESQKRLGRRSRYTRKVIDRIPFKPHYENVTKDDKEKNKGKYK